MKFLKQSTAAVVIVGPFLDKADGLTPLTAVADQSANARLVKNGTGAAFTADTWAHDALGHYKVGLTTAHTDTLGRLRLSISLPATYCPVWEDFMVLPANAYDALIGGTDALDVSVIQWLGTAPNALASGRVDAAVGAYGSGLDPATQVLATPAQRLATDSSGRVNALDGSGAALATAQGITDIKGASFGAGDDLHSLKAALPSAAPSASSVASAVRTELATELARVDAAVSTRAAALAGARQVTLQVRDGDGVGVPDCDVSIFDATNTVLQGTVQSGASGDVAVALDDGTYKLRPRKAGYSFTTPQTLVVSSDAAATVTAAEWTPPAPSQPSMCTIWGELFDGAAPLVGAPVKWWLDAPGEFDGLQAVRSERTTTTDGNGRYSFEAPIGATVRIVIAAAMVNVRREVPDAVSQNVATWEE